MTYESLLLRLIEKHRHAEQIFRNGDPAGDAYKVIEIAEQARTQFRTEAMSSGTCIFKEEVQEMRCRKVLQDIERMRDVIIHRCEGFADNLAAVPDWRA